MRRALPRTLILAALSAAMLAGQDTPAPSEELNKLLPAWLRFSGDYRARFEGFGDGGFRDNNDEAYLLNRVRLNLKIQPRSWLKFVFQGQDSRALWNGAAFLKVPPYRDSMDLRLGYLELGDPESRPISLRAGRQELVFGDQRLVGHTNWSNTARSFDALRATFRYKGYRLDAFASSVVVIKDGEFNEPTAGNNLHGLYGGIEKLVPKATIEPYVLWRLSPRLATETGGKGNLDFKTIGFRWVGKLPAGFDYGAEVAGQTGSLGTDKVRAWAGHWVVGYTVAAAWTPRVLIEYNYASGDKDPRDGVRGTFDELYPTAHDKYGLADQVGWRNIRDVRLGLELKPRRKWQLAITGHDWWLASARDALYNSPGNALARMPDGSAGTHVGQELDFQGIYTLSKQVQIGSGIGHIFPGEFLKKATPGKGYTFPFLMLGYSF